MLNRLGITIQGPPQNLEDGHISCILLILIEFCHVSKNLPLHCLFYFNMNIYASCNVNTARDVVTVLLIFFNTSHFANIFSHANTEAHTHKHTCMISTQEEWRRPIYTFESLQPRIVCTSPSWMVLCLHFGPKHAKFRSKITWKNGLFL